MIKGNELVEKLYSQGYCVIEQKEFGRISELGRKISKKLGITDRLKRSIDADDRSIMAARDKVNEARKNNKNNIEVIKNLGKEAKKHGIKTIKGKKKFKNLDLNNKGFNRSNPWEASRDAVDSNKMIKLTKSWSKERREVGKSLINNKSVVNLAGTQAGYAHEIGHGMNRSGWLTKRTSDKNNKVRGEYSNSRKSRRGILGAFNNWREGNIVVKEERNANNRALKLLKKAGATKEELANAKEELKQSLNTYRLARNKFTKKPILDSLRSADPRPKKKGGWV